MTIEIGARARREGTRSMATERGSVLQVVTSTDRRGAELFAIELGRELDDFGWTVRTVALAPGRGTSLLELDALGKKPLAMSTLRALRREMRAASVTIAHGSRTLPATALASLGVRARVVYRNIGDPSHWISSWNRRLRAGWAMRRATAVVGLTDGASRALRETLGVAPQRITVIPQGVDVDRFRPATAEQRAQARRSLGVPADAPAVAWVGAFTAEKDPALALAVAEKLDDAHTILVGDGPLRGDLERYAERLDRVHFVGELADITPVYEAADVVMLTSHSEGMPAALIESGMCGLPVVSTDVGFVADIVHSDVTGYVVDSRESTKLADAVRAALRDRDALGRAARDHCAANFNLSQVAARWDALLMDVVAH